MPNSALAKFRRHCYIASVIPVIALAMLTLAFRQMNGLALFIMASLIGIGAVWHFSRLVARYEELSWRQQIQAAIQKATTPVLVADKNHRIFSLNDNFCRLPLATMLSRVRTLNDLLACQETEQAETSLDTFAGKIKTHLQWQGNRYELMLIPLYNSINLRIGTLVEVLLKNETNSSPKVTDDIPASSLLEQISVPFLFVNEAQRVTFANLSLKMLLIRHAAHIQALCPEMDVYDPSQMTVDQLLTLIGKEKESFFNLVQQGTVQAKLGEDQFNISLQPLWTADNERLGMLILWQPSSVKNSVVHQDENFILNALNHVSSPLIVLDKNYKIQHATPLPWLTDELRQKNFIELIDEVFPRLKNNIRRSFKRSEISTFLVEHSGEFYDWVVNPIKENKQITGYIIEMIAPSYQEIKGLEEREQRLRDKKQKLEKELAKFTHGLMEFKLYQQGAEGLTHLKMEEYQHPLLKNSTKMIQHLAGNLHKLNEKISHLHRLLQEGTDQGEQALALPLQQMSILATSVLRNVQDAKQDCAILDQELLKFKGAIREQKGFNQAFIKPVTKAITASEQGLMQSVSHSQTITIILQQLHENQIALSEVQTFLEHLGKLKGSSEFDAIEQLYQQGVTQLDKVKQTMVIGKGRLRDLLMNYDSLKEGWNETLDSLRSCLKLNSTVEHAAGRWNSISEAADGYSQLLQNRLQNLVELAQKIQTKSSAWKAQPAPEAALPHFNQIAIEVNEKIKQAEDVLVEGIGQKTR